MSARDRRGTAAATQGRLARVPPLRRERYGLTMEVLRIRQLLCGVFLVVACAAPTRSNSAPPASGPTPSEVSRAVAGDTVFISQVTPDSVALTIDVSESVTPGVISFREGPSDSARPFCRPGIPAGTPTPTVRWCPRTSEDVRVWVRVVDQRPIGSVISAARATTPSAGSPSRATGDAGAASTMSPGGDPELPRSLPRLPSRFDHTIRVPAGGDLQAAIQRATAGTQILLAAGATYEGPFRLPDRGDDGWVRIATDITAPEARIDTASDVTASFATVTSRSDFGTILVNNAGGGWSLDLLNITYDGERTNALVYVDNRSGEIPDGILIDRSWLHRRSPEHWLTRCVIANGSNFTVRRSALTGCTRPSQQTQGVAQWNTPGPTLIEDNLIMAGSQAYLCGGAGGVSAHPSDITIRRNHLYTPASWQGRYHNLAPIETKDCHRLLIEATVIDGGEFGMLLKSSAQQGVCGTGCGTEHVTVRNTIFRNTRGGVNTSRLSAGSDLPMHDVLFDNVLFENIGPDSQGWQKGEGRLFQVLGATPRLTIRNTTFRTNGHSYLYLANGPPSPQQDLTIDNVVVAGRLRYRMLVQNPSAFGRHYATHQLGTVFGDCGTAPAPVTCLRSIREGAGADMTQLREATAGVVR